MCVIGHLERSANEKMMMTMTKSQGKSSGQRKKDHFHGNGQIISFDISAKCFFDDREKN